ncbi:MAG TPA: hypothetical protein VIQ26_04940, partial [Microbacteriaceae bacterium]
MNQPLQPLMDDLVSLDAAWSGARPAFGGGRVGGRVDADGTGAVADLVQVDLESMSDAGLVATMTAVGRLIREANGLLARGAAE